MPRLPFARSRVARIRPAAPVPAASLPVALLLAAVPPAALLPALGPAPAAAQERFPDPPPGHGLYSDAKDEFLPELPSWTAVGVTELYSPGVLIEVKVIAAVDEAG